MFVAGFVWLGILLLIPEKRPKSPDTAADRGADKKDERDGTVSLYGFEFNINRDVLAKRRNISQILEEADSVWALWNTGQDAWRRHVLRNPIIKQLILPDPHSDAITLLANGRQRQPYELVCEIISTTQEAKTGNIPVRWYRGLIGNTMTFVNPESDNGWVQIEVVFATMDSQTCPSFRIDQRGPYRALYESLLNAYSRVWDASSPAP